MSTTVKASALPEMDDMRHNIEHYKISLRSGERALTGPRGSGKTQAILEYAHELMHAGIPVALVFHNWFLAEEAKKRYRALTGGEKPEPSFHTEAQRGLRMDTVFLFDGFLPLKEELERCLERAKTA